MSRRSLDQTSSIRLAHPRLRDQLVLYPRREPAFRDVRGNIAPDLDSASRTHRPELSCSEMTVRIRHPSLARSDP
jgi:hypothetical protein